MSKKKTDPEPKPERVGGSVVPSHERLWSHRVIDHVIAQERALGSSRRPPATR